MIPTFKDLYEFVLEHKKDKTFIGMDNLHIAGLLKEGIDSGTLLVATDLHGKISGMILAEIRKEDGVLFVTENLALSLKNLKQFAAIAKSRWPELRLEWLKHGIHKKHNTDKIYSKLTSGL